MPVRLAGEVMESPFRVMDEFDVYMDTVNRRIALKKLMETCTNFKNRSPVACLCTRLSALCACMPADVDSCRLV